MVTCLGCRRAVPVHVTEPFAGSADAGRPALEDVASAAEAASADCELTPTHPEQNGDECKGGDVPRESGGPGQDRGARGGARGDGAESYRDGSST